MIKTILVPATGTDADTAVFASALAVARTFAAHLDFLHVRPDASATAASMTSDGSGAAMVTGLMERIEQEAEQREKTAQQLFASFARGRGWEKRNPRRPAVALRRNGPGKSATNPIGWRSAGAPPTCW